MLNVVDVTQALESQIKADPTAGKYTVERGEPINMDAGSAATGWVGIYKGKMSLTSLGMAGGKRWRVDPLQLIVVVQAASMKDGKDCDERLQEYLSAVLSAINSDPTIGGTVQFIQGFEIEYDYEMTESGGAWMQDARIAVELTTKTGD